MYNAKLSDNNKFSSWKQYKLAEESKKFPSSKFKKSEGRTMPQACSGIRQKRSFGSGWAAGSMNPSLTLSSKSRPTLSSNYGVAAGTTSVHRLEDSRSSEAGAPRSVVKKPSDIASMAPEPVKYSPPKPVQHPPQKPSKSSDDPISVVGAGVAVVKSFDDMGLDDDLLRGVYAKGFEAPTAIQQRGIKCVISGKDTIAQAQSGTGKTGTFVIGALQRLSESDPRLQCLIMAPTRELAGQIGDEIRDLAGYMNIKSQVCTGGVSVRDSRWLLKEAQIVVGTPGRVMHMISEGTLILDSLKLFILDEADEMLKRGFRDAMYDTFQYLPQDVQVCLFSATMPQDILKLTEHFMRDPIKILVKKEEVTLDGIKQFYILLDNHNQKLETLFDLYECMTITQAMIFCNRRGGVDWLAERMHQRDFTVSSIHGELDASERNRVMKEFKQGASRVLISTDVLARGIDVQQVSLVINFDIPLDRENYIHRIGRSGRFGRKGVAINMITKDDAPALQELERFYSTKIEELPEDFMDYL